MKEDTEMTIMLVVFDERAFMLSKNLFFQIESFIDDEEVKAAHLKEYASDLSGSKERQRYRNDMLEYEHVLHNLEARQMQTRGTTKETGTGAFDEEEFKKKPGDDLSFSKHLIKLLNEKNIDNATAYKRSNITKGAFSKIMCGGTKIPKRSTVLALCIGLQLKIWEAEELLASAGMAFNPYDKGELLVIKCITEENYDIISINILARKRRKISTSENVACRETICSFIRDILIPENRKRAASGGRKAGIRYVRSNTRRHHRKCI